MSIPMFQLILLLSLWCPYVCSLHPCFYFCFANKITYTVFSRFHMYVLIYNICFSDLLYSVCPSLGPSTYTSFFSFSFFSLFPPETLLVVESGEIVQETHNGSSWSSDPFLSVFRSTGACFPPSASSQKETPGDLDGLVQIRDHAFQALHEAGLHTLLNSYWSPLLSSYPFPCALKYQHLFFAHVKFLCILKCPTHGIISVRNAPSHSSSPTKVLLITKP